MYLPGYIATLYGWLLCCVVVVEMSSQTIALPYRTTAVDYTVYAI